MLRSIKSMGDIIIAANDGEIGQVHDFFFDDEEWTIRYLVAGTGEWMDSRRVLISSAALSRPFTFALSLPVSLTREQVRNSPDIDTEKPVSRQQVELMNAYYGWPHYWTMEAAPAVPKDDRAGDPHLRSCNEVLNYHVQATDGDIGHVEDFIVEQETWAIQHIVIDTRNWLHGKKVLVAPASIDSVAWSSRDVSINLTRHEVQGSPDYNEMASVNRDYKGRLYDYHGRLK